MEPDRTLWDKEKSTAVAENRILALQLCDMGAELSCFCPDEISGRSMKDSVSNILNFATT
jgi:hypothetical protein